MALRICWAWASVQNCCRRTSGQNIPDTTRPSKSLILYHRCSARDRSHILGYSQNLTIINLVNQTTHPDVDTTRSEGPLETAQFLNRDRKPDVGRKPTIRRRSQCAPCSTERKWPAILSTDTGTVTQTAKLGPPKTYLHIIRTHITDVFKNAIERWQRSVTQRNNSKPKFTANVE